jgi:hypothetical protein
VLDEVKQAIEDARLQGNRLAVRPEEQPPDGVDAEPAEPIRHVHD